MMKTMEPQPRSLLVRNLTDMHTSSPKGALLAGEPGEEDVGIADATLRWTSAHSDANGATAVRTLPSDVLLVDKSFGTSRTRFPQPASAPSDEHPMPSSGASR